MHKNVKKALKLGLSTLKLLAALVRRFSGIRSEPKLLPQAFLHEPRHPGVRGWWGGETGVSLALCSNKAPHIALAYSTRFTTSTWERCQAWLDLYPELWSQKEWWKTSEYQSLIEHALPQLSLGPLLSYETLGKKAELEVILRVSFHKSDDMFLSLALLKILDFEPQEWNSLIKLARLAVEVQSLKREEGQAVAEFLSHQVKISLEQFEETKDQRNFCFTNLGLNRAWSLMEDKQEQFSKKEFTALLEKREGDQDLFLIHYHWSWFLQYEKARILRKKSNLLYLEIASASSQNQVLETMMDLPKETRDLLGDLDLVNQYFTITEHPLQIRE